MLGESRTKPLVRVTDSSSPRPCEHQHNYMHPSCELKQLESFSRKMWVLDAKTYKLRFFHQPPGDDTHTGPGHAFLDRRVSYYAILSHTWEEEEVTFDDIQCLEEAKKKKGFEKIRLTCQQALRDGLPYAWVDTCCIDKRSSAELSEAINSMFRWYQEAKVCYAYLSDLRLGEDSSVTYVPGVHDSNSGGNVVASARQALQERLPSCRWFSRGWTLQELVAPQHLEFFDSTWTRAGCRTELADLLTEITTIDRQILMPKIIKNHLIHDLRETSIATKLSWAGHRKTTRIEDVAYSLLDLLDVNMPLLYGEGIKAWDRLLEAVMQTTNDHSILIHENDTYTLPADPSDYVLGFNQRRNVVTLSTSRSRPLTLGATGVLVNLPVVISNRETLHAIFDCRYEADFRGKLTREIKRVNDKGPQIGEDPSKALEVAFSDSRARTYIPMLGQITVEQTLLLVLNSARERELAPAMPFRRGASLWFRPDSIFDEHFTLLWRSPEVVVTGTSITAHWNLEPLRTIEKPLRGALTWSGKWRNTWLSVLYEVTYTVTKVQRDDWPHHRDYRKQYLVSLVRSSSSADAERVAVDYVHDQKASGFAARKLLVAWNNYSNWQPKMAREQIGAEGLDISSNGAVRFSMTEREILEGRVCVIDLEFIDKCAATSDVW